MREFRESNQRVRHSWMGAVQNRPNTIDDINIANAAKTNCLNAAAAINTLKWRAPLSRKRAATAGKAPARKYASSNIQVMPNTTTLTTAVERNVVAYRVQIWRARAISAARFRNNSAGSRT